LAHWQRFLLGGSAPHAVAADNRLAGHDAWAALSENFVLTTRAQSGHATPCRIIYTQHRGGGTFARLPTPKVEPETFIPYAKPETKLGSEAVYVPIEIQWSIFASVATWHLVATTSAERLRWKKTWPTWALELYPAVQLEIFTDGEHMGKAGPTFYAPAPKPKLSRPLAIIPYLPTVCGAVASECALE
jgi:hypothetical protein